MGSHTAETEVLILHDGDANLYAIPWETVQLYKVPEEGKALLAQSLGDDVSGYAYKPGQHLVDRSDILGAGLLRAEGMSSRTQSSGGVEANSASMSPIGAVSGFFAVVHDLNRYLHREKHNNRRD